MSIKHPNRNLANDIRRYRRAGMPIKMIVNCLAISEETLRLHYSKELNYGKASAITELATLAYDMAANGNERMLKFLLSTQGSEFGFNQKQIIEATNNNESIEEIQKRLEEAEQRHLKDY